MTDADGTKGVGPQGPIPALVNAVDKAAIWSAAAIVVGTLTVLFLAIFTNVVLRYTFRVGITWAYEIPVVLFPWMVVAGAVLAAQKSQHIAVQLIVFMLPKRLRKAFLIAGHLLIFVMCVLVAKSGLPMIDAARDSHLVVTGISEAWGYTSLVYGYIMMAVTSLTISYRVAVASEENITDHMFGGSQA